MRPLNIREVGEVVILLLDDASSLNDGQSDEYRVQVYELVESRPRNPIVVDLGEIEILSSSGVAFLIQIRRKVTQSRGILVLIRMNALIEDLLRIMKLTPLFTIAPDEEAAMRLLSSMPSG